MGELEQKSCAQVGSGMGGRYRLGSREWALYLSPGEIKAAPTYRVATAKTPECPNSQVQKLSHISFYNNTVENRQKIIRQTEN